MLNARCRLFRRVVCNKTPQWDRFKHWHFTKASAILIYISIVWEAMVYIYIYITNLTEQYRSGKTFIWQLNWIVLLLYSIFHCEYAHTHTHIYRHSNRQAQGQNIRLVGIVFHYTLRVQCGVFRCFDCQYRFVWVCVYFQNGVWLRVFYCDKLKIRFVGHCNSIAIKYVNNESVPFLPFVWN